MKELLAAQAELCYLRFNMIDTPLPISLYVANEDLPHNQQDSILQALSRAMADRIGREHEAAILRSAREREALEPTYIGRSIAVPHARVRELPGASVLIARCSIGAPWPVELAKLIIFLAVPEERPDIYLQLLGGIMRWRHSLGLTQEQLLTMSPEAMENSLRTFLKL